MKKLLVIIALLFAYMLGDAKPDSCYYYEFYETWMLVSKTIYDYPDANTTSKTIYLYNITNGLFDLSATEIWTVDEYGNINSWTDEMFGVSLVQTVTNTYEDDKIIEAIWQSNGWNGRRDLYTWDGDNNVEMVTQDWDYDDWENNERELYSYNGNILSETITQDWYDGAWENEYKMVNNYDGSRLDFWYKYWWYDDTWDSYSKHEIIYDDLGRKSEVHNFDWDYSNDEYAIMSKEIYFYGDGSTSITDNESVPKNFSLNNYPNPFNPSTNICFELPENDKVTLQMYNMNGELVKTIVNNESKSAGRHEVIWDATDNGNLHVPTGIYFYSISTENFTKTNRCLYLK